MVHNLHAPGWVRTRVRVWIVLSFLCGFAAAAAIAVYRPDWLPLHRLLRVESPHERYARLLGAAGLQDTALVHDWFSAARTALDRPASVELPFATEAVLDPARPAALGYAVKGRRGQTLAVRVAADAGDPPARIFIDLFTRPADATAEPVSLASAAEEATEISRELRRAGTYLVRIQPELLRGGRMRVTVEAVPSLAFPVPGAGAPQSGFGAERDAGRRRHEGVDIFAPRGTPVVAASSGVVTRVGENRLGGRVVWTWDMARGLTLYYAHLQEQRVRTGRFVQAGETLGTVGNTGNARTTPPHLHFGIYAAGEGAIDPAPFITAGSRAAHRLSR